ncbi:helix-turn-helix transcriptional regulator [Gordonia sp. VNQ95]|jgi:transcriptional regulator with XRE-family HTH domain|uniref:helix-turn-helix domain-containing protein n=1 Tax=Gordonia TaxID=2053 RepID=UPI0032B3E7BA
MILSVKRLAARRSARAEVQFKRELVEAREAAGLSQRRLAALMGVDHSTVSRMERLDSNPRLSDIRQYLTQCKAALDMRVVHCSEIEAEYEQSLVRGFMPSNRLLYDAEDGFVDESSDVVRPRRVGKFA